MKFDEFFENFVKDGLAEPISQALYTCSLLRTEDECRSELEPPYVVRYAQVSGVNNPGNGLSCGGPQSNLPGHLIVLSSTSWSQTVRAHPNTGY